MSVTVIRGEQVNAQLAKELRDARNELERARMDLRAAHACIARQESLIAALRQNAEDRAEVLREVCRQRDIVVIH